MSTKPAARQPIRQVKNTVRRYLDYLADLRVPALTGLISNGEVQQDDVFIVGFMKSGTTWFLNLVAGAIYGIDPEYAPHYLVTDLIPQHYGSAKKYHKRYSSPMFFRSHVLPRPEYRRVVYLYRDGRDVMVSYYHHLKATRGRDIDFLSVVRGEEQLYPGRWHEHVESWLSNPYGAQMVVIKYEDLKTDAVRELQRFCEFVGLERDHSYLEMIVEKATFAKMRQKEAVFGVPHWPREHQFVRRGEVGSYKDEMPPNVLEAFLRDAGTTLQRLGYV